MCFVSASFAIIYKTFVGPLLGSGRFCQLETEELIQLNSHLCAVSSSTRRFLVFAECVADTPVTASKLDTDLTE